MEKKKRIAKASKAYCEESENCGVEVCSWEEMPGFRSFVEGDMTESQLSEQAAEEVAQLNETFRKYTEIEKEPEEGSPEFEEETARKRRADIANKIYRRACADSGRGHCFFKNFSTWQRFVHGEIGEEELYRNAVQEVRQMAAEMEN